MHGFQDTRQAAAHTNKKVWRGEIKNVALLNERNCVLRRCTEFIKYLKNSLIFSSFLYFIKNESIRIKNDETILLPCGINFGVAVRAKRTVFGRPTSNAHRQLHMFLKYGKKDVFVWQVIKKVLFCSNISKSRLKSQCTYYRRNRNSHECVKAIKD